MSNADMDQVGAFRETVALPERTGHAGEPGQRPGPSREWRSGADDPAGRKGILVAVPKFEEVGEVCKSSSEAGGPRRCSGDARKNLERSEAAVQREQERHRNVSGYMNSGGGFTDPAAEVAPGSPRRTCSHQAVIRLPDGTTATYGRWGDTSKFVVYGLDAVGVRKGEKPGVAQWCANERGARNMLAEWRQRYGGEWSILPVTYTEPFDMAEPPTEVRSPAN